MGLCLRLVVLDIQLKVLQALPTLLSNYADSFISNTLHDALDVCFILHACKAGVVSNTAAAVIQQVFAATFEKVEKEDGAIYSANDVLPG